MKNSLNDISKELWKGYSILDASLSLNGDYNDFTIMLTSANSEKIDYPTMIYDGPFSDSQVNKEIKGLCFLEVSEQEAKNNLLKIFSDYTSEMVISKGETKSRFNVFNFEVQKNGETIAYIQMTKKGGKLLTCSAFNDKKAENLTIENAKQIALDFAKKNELNEIQVVWSDTVGGNAFVNLAPVENGVIIYPDLVKVKIDLFKGAVLGYEATSYFTNHKARAISTPKIEKNIAKGKINKKFQIKNINLALIPLDYGQEILSWEFECNLGGDTYYVYIDTQNGSEINILKVIQTDNGALLM